jgi:hypothetical protein
LWGRWLYLSGSGQDTVIKRQETSWSHVWHLASQEDSAPWSLIYIPVCTTVSSHTLPYHSHMTTFSFVRRMNPSVPYRDGLLAETYTSRNNHLVLTRLKFCFQGWQSLASHGSILLTEWNMISNSLQPHFTIPSKKWWNTSSRIYIQLIW